MQRMYALHTHSITHTYFFMQQNRAFWLLSSFQRFIYYFCCFFCFCFSIASIIYCVDIMLCQYYCLCCVFAYVMFHASMYFFHRLFLSFVRIKYTNIIKYSRVGRYLALKCARTCFVFGILLFLEKKCFFHWVFYYEFQCCGM